MGRKCSWTYTNECFSYRAPTVQNTTFLALGEGTLAKSRAFSNTANMKTGRGHRRTQGSNAEVGGLTSASPKILGRGEGRDFGRRGRGGGEFTYI